MAGKTEWEDALIKHGIMQAPEEQETEDEKAVRLQEEAASVDVFANKTLEELNAMEDDADEDVLEVYRRQRLQQMKEEAARNIFGSLIQVGQTDYKESVTIASEKHPVVVHLMEAGSEECQLLNNCLSVVANKFRAVKFVKVIAQEAIANFPRTNCPTVLVYKDGNIVAQFVKMHAFAGRRTTPAVVEWVLSERGIIKTELETDPRLEVMRTKINSAAAAAVEAEDSDSDW